QELAGQKSYQYQENVKNFRLSIMLLSIVAIYVTYPHGVCYNSGVRCTVFEPRIPNPESRPKG
ncbi:MAG: hypothetical protein LBB49_05550, partial [Gracilibacteraceae bacterium]|nr:hypothetical protein [Gracilibacteraceae bacterium]